MLIKVKNIQVLQYLISFLIIFSTINNIARSNRESVLKTFNLLTVEQLLLYFIYKQTYISMNYKIYIVLPSFSIMNICKSLKLYKIEIYSELNCIADQNSVDIGLKILRIKLKSNTIRYLQINSLPRHSNLKRTQQKQDQL